MKNTFNIQFYARESKKDKNGYCHLEMSINANQKRVFINLPFLVQPEKWNSKRRPKEYEDYASMMRTRVNQILVDMMSHEEPITSERIREYVRFGGYKSYTVEDMFDDYLSIIRNRIGKDMSEPVFRKYELVKEMYLEDNDGSKELSSITPHTINTFYSKLRGKFQTSTSAGYMTKLKTFVRYAIDNGKMSVNPFANIKITKDSKPIDYLTEEQIKVLESTELENQSLQNVLDCFIFQMSSGLSYADMVTLTKEDIQNDGEGHYFIHKRRVKTNTEYMAVILPSGMKILEKYDYNLNVISNQKMNAYLHVIEDLLGLDIKLHTHLARHTYCTLLLNKGIRLEVVSKAAGHSSTKVTQKFYAHLENKTIVDEVSKAMNL